MLTNEGLNFEELGLLQMGHCPCFGRRKKGIVSTNQKNDDQKQERINSRGTIKSSVVVEQKLDTPDSKDENHSKNNAKTFSYRELATATKNFRQESFIGEGGFGAVYKGKLESTDQLIAVKQLNHSGLQGTKEFLVEVLMLSLLRHPNLVNLIGYCAEGDQRLLVYEFMPLGSLEDHLHDLEPGVQPLDWNTRMMIAAGAAKGLNFLHNEANPPVIYRDLKSSNILLDKGFHPRLSDFGLAKFGPDKDKSHVSTRVMGTQGYCAPEYAGTGKLTVKSDIYTYGVVLLELITGRRPIDMARGDGKHVLVDWARPMLQDRNNLISLADPLLKGQFPERSLRKAFEVAIMCLREDAQLRPDMKDVMFAMNYLASKKYNPNAARGRDMNIHEGQGQTNKGLDNENLEEMRLLNKTEDRQRAVAEAKMWGETWRDKRVQQMMNDSDELSPN